MSTPTTRHLCPLCDWHHDSEDPALTTPAAGAPIKGSSLQDLVEAHVQQILTEHYAVLEVIVREHLETHPLIDWVREVARLQQELNAAVAKGVVWAPVGESVDCGFPLVPPRQHSEALKQQVRKVFGTPLRTPATSGRLSAIVPDIPLTSRNTVVKEEQQ